MRPPRLESVRAELAGIALYAPPADDHGALADRWFHVTAPSVHASSSR